MKIKQGQQVLALEAILDELLSSNPSIRAAAEEQIHQVQSQPGILSSLIKYGCTGAADTNLIEILSPSAYDRHTEISTDLESPKPLHDTHHFVRKSSTSSSRSASAFTEDVDVRDVNVTAPESAARRALAAVLAKRIVQEEWTSRTETERLEVKGLLLSHLVNLPLTVRSSIHVIVASIAYQDSLRDGWPSLIPRIRFLLDQYRERSANTAILDLLIIMAKPDHPQETLARDLLSEHDGVQDGLLFLAQGMKQLNISRRKEVVMVKAECRRKCLEVFRMCVKGVVEYSQQSDATKTLVLPYILKWCAVIDSLMMEVSATPTDLDAVQSALSSLRCLLTFFSAKCQILENAAFSCLRTTVQECLKVLVALYPCYENMTINDVDGVAGIEEEEEGGPTSFVVQLCNLLVICTSRPSLRRGMVEGHIREILGALIKYLQVTELQKECWLSDANEYLAQEEEGFSLELSLRQSGRELIDQLLDTFHKDTTDDMIESVMALFEISRKRQDEDNFKNNYWKFSELAFWLIGIIAERNDFEAIEHRPEFEFVVLWIGGAVGNNQSPPLLRSRALLTATKLSRFLFKKYPNDIDKLLLISANATSSDEAPPVRVAALRALSVFLLGSPTNKSSIVIKEDVLNNLVQFMKTAMEDSLRLVLDVFKQIVNVCPQCLASVEETIISLILEKWSKCSNDPLTNIDFQEFFGVACSTNSRLRESLHRYLLPQIMKSFESAIRNPDNIDSHQLGMSLELYSLLLRDTPDKPLPDMLWAGFNLVMLILLRVEEASAVQCACETFTLLLIKFENKIREESKLQEVLRVAERLLSPTLDDHAALMAGPLLQVFIRLFGAELPSDLIKQIFSAMLRRMVTAKLPALQESVMVVFSRFVCLGSEQMFDVLDSINVMVQDDQQVSGFLVLVRFWMQWLSRPMAAFRSKYVRNVTYSAILSLLQNRRQELMNLSSSGDLVAEIMGLLIRGLGAIMNRERNRTLRLRKHLAETSSNKERSVVELSESMDGGPSTEEELDAHSQEGSYELIANDFEDDYDDNNDDFLDFGGNDEAGSRSVIAIEEEKDALSHIDIQAILLSQLRDMASPQSDFRTSFLRMDVETLHMWTQCQSNPSSNESNNSIDVLTSNQSLK